MFTFKKLYCSLSFSPAVVWETRAFRLNSSNFSSSPNNNNSNSELGSSSLVFGISFFKQHSLHVIPPVCLLWLSWPTRSFALYSANCSLLFLTHSLRDTARQPVFCGFSAHRLQRWTFSFNWAALSTLSNHLIYFEI